MSRWDPNIGSQVVKEGVGWIVSVTPMIFNDRVILTMRDEYPTSWTAAWCYRKGPAAVLAALAWDPDAEHEPVGYIKIAGDSRSIAKH